MVYAKIDEPPTQAPMKARKGGIHAEKFTGTPKQWLAFGGMLAVAGAVVWLCIAAENQQNRTDALHAQENAVALKKSAEAYAIGSFQDGVDKLHSLAEAWATQIELASATPRMLLVQQRIPEMDQVLSRMAAVHIRDACLDHVRQSLLNAARQRRNEYLAFAQDENSASASIGLEADQAERDLSEQLGKCKQPASSAADQ